MENNSNWMIFRQTSWSITGLPLSKSVIKPLGLLVLTAATSTRDAGIQKNIYSGSGTTTLVI